MNVSQQKNHLSEMEPIRFDDSTLLDSGLPSPEQNDGTLLMSKDSADDEVICEINSNTSSMYENFETIDWHRDLARDRCRTRQLFLASRKTTRAKFSYRIDTASGLMCLMLVGLLCGCIASMIDLGGAWLSNLKDGMCSDGFWHSRESCCHHENDNHKHSNTSNGHCESWLPWSEVFGLHDKTIIFVVDYAMFVGLGMLFALIVTLMVTYIAPHATGSGIAEIKCILSGFVLREFLSKRVLFVKSFGMMLSTASGLCVGKEGPMVHVCCCVGNMMAKFFPKYGKNEAKKREILSASAAAAISVAFGAPIGGVLFSLEEASYYFPMKTLWRSFFCALVSGVVLRLINPFGAYASSPFQMHYMMRWSYFELIPFAILGVVGGFIGAMFIKINQAWCRYKKNSPTIKRFPITEVLVLTFISTVVSFPNEYMRLNGLELLRLMFDRCEPNDDLSDICDYINRTYESNDHLIIKSGLPGPGIPYAAMKLSIAVIVKLILTSLAIGIKVPGGLLIPNLAIGACLGRLMGLGLEALARYAPNIWIWNQYFCKRGEQCVIPGLYAVVGASTVLAGATRSMVALVVIMFELVGRLEIIVPVMLAVMCAKWTADAVQKHSIYDAQIAMNNYAFLDFHENFHHQTVAGDVMYPQSGDDPLVVLKQDSMTVQEIEDVLANSKYNGYPVIGGNDQMHVMGFVTRKELKIALEQLKFGDGVDASSKVHFTTEHRLLIISQKGSMPSVSLRYCIDPAPICVCEKMPMETVVDLFRKIGIRQVLVTHNGHLVGIITKKDLLKHIKQLEHEDHLGLQKFMRQLSEKLSL